jgi:hypothetical protein
MPKDPIDIKEYGDNLPCFSLLPEMLSYESLGL